MTLGAMTARGKGQVASNMGLMSQHQKQQLLAVNLGMATAALNEKGDCDIGCGAFDFITL
jgi:hypothetical protein